MGVAPGSGGLDGWVDWARLVLELLMNDELLIERELAAAGGRPAAGLRTDEEKMVRRR